MKKTKVCMVGLCTAMLVGAIFFIFHSRSQATSHLLFTLEQVEALAQVETITLQDQMNNAGSCTTTKEFKIDIGNGNFTFEYRDVTGLENPCRNKPGTCEAFACYAN